MNIRLEKHQFFIFLLPLLGGLLSVAGCLSEIDLKAPETNIPSIAIRGRLLATEVPDIFVKITKVTNFRAFDIPEAVIGAKVVLSDEQNHSLEIPMQKDGEYGLTIPDNTYDLEVKPGKSYQLSVTTTSGDIYVSTVETLYPAPTPTAITHISEIRQVLNDFGKIEDQKFLRFLITTPLVNPDLSGRAYLKWSFVGTYKFMESAVAGAPIPNVHTCFFNDPLNRDKVVTFNGTESSRDILSDFFLLEEPFDYRFYDGFYLSVFQQSLSEGAYRYWNKIGKAVDISGTFFETPPGKILGNFHNQNDPKEEVFGYFYVAQETVIRYYIPPAPDQVSRYCPATVSNSNEAPGDCLNCLLHPGSTLGKPDFWEY